MLYFFGLLAALCTLLVPYLVRLQKTKAVSEKDEKKKEEAPFAFPHVDPVSYDPLQRPPAPYRAFKPKYHINMAIRAINLLDWIEVDRMYPIYFYARKKRADEKKTDVVCTLPSAQAAVLEMCQDLCEYLSRKYPTVFQITERRRDAEGWDGLGSVRLIHVPCVDTTFDLDVEDPMYVAGLLVSDDLAIMNKRDDGMYYLEAYAIIFAGTWRPKDKLGMSLRDIHLSGSVPHYKEKLELSMDRYFAKIPVEKPIVRNSKRVWTYMANTVSILGLDYAIQIGDEIPWVTSLLGPEDEYQHDQNRVKVYENGSDPSLTKPKVTDPAQLHLRQERQYLRRLPKNNNALAFNFRTYLEPVPNIVNEPGVPGRLASAVRSWSDDIRKYKAGAEYGHVLLRMPLLVFVGYGSDPRCIMTAYLDAHHQKQIEEGIVAADDTLSPTNFPF